MLGDGLCLLGSAFWTVQKGAWHPTTTPEWAMGAPPPHALLNSSDSVNCSRPLPCASTVFARPRDPCLTLAFLTTGLIHVLPERTRHQESQESNLVPCTTGCSMGGGDACAIGVMDGHGQATCEQPVKGGASCSTIGMVDPHRSIIRLQTQDQGPLPSGLWAVLLIRMPFLVAICNPQASGYCKTVSQRRPPV